MNRFVFFPDPPHQGASLTICYLFDLDPKVEGPITADINMSPPDGSVTVELSRDQTCKTVLVPDGAVGVTAHDPSMQSEDYTRPTVTTG